MTEKIKSFDMKPKKIGENLYQFIASDERIDRDGDIIRVRGWDLKNFKNNPVILYGHGHGSDLPIGRGVKVFKDLSSEPKRLIINFEFIPKEIYPFAGLIKDMVDGDYLRTGSVRFIPRERGDLQDGDIPEGYTGRKGIEFKKQELVEYSIVPLPANVGAEQLNLKDYSAMADNKEKDINRWLKNGDYEIIETEDGIEIIDDEVKGVIPYRRYASAPEGERWSGPAEVRRAEVKDLKQMCTWFDGENPDVKGSYKLPHHKAKGYTTIWQGVATAMGALLGARGGVQLPGGDRKGVYNHLVKHYKDFDKEPPEFKEYDYHELEELVLSGKIIIDDKREGNDVEYSEGYEDGYDAGYSDSFKSGRVLSAKNRNVVLKAVAVLQELLSATEPDEEDNVRSVKDIIEEYNEKYLNKTDLDKLVENKS